MSILFILWIFGCGLFAKIFNEKTKRVLDEEVIEYAKSYFRFSYLKYLEQLIPNTSDPDKKATYKALYAIQIVLLLLYFLGSPLVFIYTY